VSDTIAAITSRRTSRSAERAIGIGDKKFASRSIQPVEVAGLVDQMAAPDLADLVNPVGELVTPILDVDRGL
jgi:hypothetical protein